MSQIGRTFPNNVAAFAFTFWKCLIILGHILEGLTFLLRWLSDEGLVWPTSFFLENMEEASAIIVHSSKWLFCQAYLLGYCWFWTYAWNGKYQFQSDAVFFPVYEIYVHSILCMHTYYRPIWSWSIQNTFSDLSVSPDRS